MTTVLNKRNGNIPSDAVYIGRGSPWGNPYIIGRDGTREDVVRKFKMITLKHLDLTPLIGKDLVCFCAPKLCHGHVIKVELARRKRA
ncbi:MAG: DUF4326 domain-containing protein [bacterium]